MLIKKRFIKGIVLAPDTFSLDNVEGEIKVDSADGKIKVYLKDGANPSAAREVVTNSQAQTLTNKTINLDNNTVSNIQTSNLKSGVLNTSTTLASATNSQLPSALAVKTYIEAHTGITGAQVSANVHGIGSGNSVVGTGTSQTLTNKTLTSPVINTGVSGTAINTSTTLAGATNTQVPSALAVKTYADNIPSSIIVSQTSFTIANNQSSAANITGLLFSPTLFRSVKIEYALYRQTDTAGSARAQMGQLRFVYNTQAASWFVSDDFAGQDAGVTFSITSSGQIQYTSTDISGTNYSGNLKYSVIKTFGV